WTSARDTDFETLAIFRKLVAQKHVVILSEAKDLLSYQCKRQQVLRFAQDDKLKMLALRPPRSLRFILSTAYPLQIPESHLLRPAHFLEMPDGISSCAELPESLRWFPLRRARVPSSLSERRSGRECRRIPRESCAAPAAGLCAWLQGR